MNIAFLLMAQYDGRDVIPLDDVCHDYFSHLTPVEFVRRATAGEIAVPVIRMMSCQKAARRVHLQELADWIHARRAVAKKDCNQLAGLK